MFINKNVEGERERGVCATALAEDASLSGGRRGKRAGYFLLSSSGSARRKGRDEPGDRRGEEESLPGSVHIPHRFTWRVAPLPPQYSPGSLDPTPPTTATPAADSAAPSPRSAAQRSPARQTGGAQRQGGADPGVRAAEPPIQLGSSAVAVAAMAPGGAASTSDLGCHPRGRRGGVGGTAAGARARRGAIPVTRFKEMEEGETSYPMAREDRETAVTEEER